MAIDHSPAWALIPWYGSDGLGAPTLDDWRVWADWLQAHDPDDERDAVIARALSCGWADEVIAVRCVRAYMSVGRPAAAPPMPGAVRPRYVGAEFLGFEAQPTRREMRPCGWWCAGERAMLADGSPGLRPRGYIADDSGGEYA